MVEVHAPRERMRGGGGEEGRRPVGEERRGTGLGRIQPQVSESDPGFVILELTT